MWLKSAPVGFIWLGLHLDFLSLSGDLLPAESLLTSSQRVPKIQQLLCLFLTRTKFVQVRCMHNDPKLTQHTKHCANNQPLLLTISGLQGPVWTTHHFFVCDWLLINSARCLGIIPRHDGFHQCHHGAFSLTLHALNYLIRIFTPLKLCLTTATHNFKGVTISRICFI